MSVRSPSRIASRCVCVTVSVGGATAVPCRGESAPLLEAAAAALYEAKRIGKNRAVNHELR